MEWHSTRQDGERGFCVFVSIFCPPGYWLSIGLHVEDNYGAVWASGYDGKAMDMSGSKKGQKRKKVENVKVRCYASRL